MSTVIRLVAAAAAAYLIGSLSPSYWMVKLFKGMDIRRFGSGNPGMTNVYRLMGLGPAAAVLALDIFKGFAAVHWVAYLAGPDFPPVWSQLACAAAVVAGHMWSLFLRFKGGRGVNTAAGAFLALTPWAALGAVVVWGIVFLLGRIVSLASIVAALALTPLVLLAGAGLGRPAGAPVVLLALLAALAIIWRHRDNIRRLLKGQEGRLRKADLHPGDESQ